ncbi:hypothetical protein MTR_1g104690 [Medicago truncatula]|uniref:Uncharacterized protein n=1 Tax=Medicago truncatula TaxID=3880 RepID=G7ID74_MEDTR|nr:hypothetical protein MTR_1g104690 [Medicago truncatula]
MKLQAFVLDVSKNTTLSAKRTIFLSSFWIGTSKFLTCNSNNIDFDGSLFLFLDHKRKMWLMEGK